MWFFFFFILNLIRISIERNRTLPDSYYCVFEFFSFCILFFSPSCLIPCRIKKKWDRDRCKRDIFWNNFPSAFDANKVRWIFIFHLDLIDGKFNSVYREIEGDILNFFFHLHQVFEVSIESIHCFVQNAKTQITHTPLPNVCRAYVLST